LDIENCIRGTALREDRLVINSPLELLGGFDQGGALKRSPALPTIQSQLRSTGLCKVIRQKLRLGRGDDRVIAPRPSYSAMQGLTPAFEKTFVGCVLNKSVLETIIGLRRHTLREKDVRFG
jgi:hypothetical protein